MSQEQGSGGPVVESGPFSFAAPAWRGADVERLAGEGRDRQSRWVARHVLLVDSGRREAAPSLENETLDPQPVWQEGFVCTHPGDWKAKVVTYSSGVVEASVFNGSVGTGRRESSGSGSVPRSGNRSGCRSEQSLSRSRALCRRRILSLDADHMLTLTKRGKFGSSRELWRAFRLFSQSMKRRYGARWQYVAVPELHADGETWHCHVAVKGFFWAGTLRRFWMRALGGTGEEEGSDTPGNVDAKYFKCGAGAAASRRMAGYVAKYLGKGFAESGSNARLFAASSGLHPARIERWSTLFFDGPENAAVGLQRFLHALGSVERGACVFWSHGRAVGFRLSTEMRC